MLKVIKTLTENLDKSFKCTECGEELLYNGNNFNFLSDKIQDLEEQYECDKCNLIFDYVHILSKINISKEIHDDE